MCVFPCAKLSCLSHIVHRSAQSYLTRAGDRSKHPALSISDRQTLLFVPGAQNLHAAPPGHRIDASLIVTGPSPQQHTSIVITIDLMWEESTQIHRLIPKIKNRRLFFREKKVNKEDMTTRVRYESYHGTEHSGNIHRVPSSWMVFARVPLTFRIHIQDSQRSIQDSTFKLRNIKEKGEQG